MHPSPRLRSTCVKLYLCSNPADSEEERSALRKSVFPKFREHCKKTSGVDVRVIDPYESRDVSLWPDDNRRQQLIKECRESSAGPFLLALVGHRYGRTSLPAQVEVSEFQLLLQESQRAGLCTRDLERVYQRDENTDPRSYRRLSCRPTTQQSGATEQSEEEDEEKVAKLFSNAVRLCVENRRLSEEKAKRFTRSAVDADLRFALEGCPPDDIIRRCLVYINNVVNAKGERGKKQSTSETPEQSQSLTDLCENFLRQLITSCPLLVYTTTTECDRRFGYTTARRRMYAEALCQQVYLDLTGLMENMSHSYVREDESMDEQEQLCDVLSKSYEITRPEENQILEYVAQSDQRLPLVVTGGPCSGKTVLLAHCAQQIKSSFPDTDPVVLPHFSGFMNETSPKNLLIDMCHRITRSYNRNKDPLNLPEGSCSPAGCSQNMSSHTEVLENLLFLLNNLPSSRRPLILILDGLDQFGITFATTVIESFPSPLPLLVKLIITVSSKHCHAFELQVQPCNRLQNHSGYACLPLGPVERRHCVTMLTTLLRRSGRRVTSGQQVLVNQALTSCCLTLYARLLHELTSLWTSDLDVSGLYPPDGVHSMISTFFDNLERKHGCGLVSRTVSYLTVSRAGLTESELHDLLSGDANVLSEQREDDDLNSDVSQVDLEMLLLDLKSCLIRREVRGVPVLSWSSRHFALVVAKRYFGKETKATLHSIMVDYFSIGWLHFQPTLTELYQNVNSPHEPRSSWNQFRSRKVVEFVYHLQKSDRHTLKEALLVSFEFHQALVGAGLLMELIDMIRSNSREGAILAGTLASSSCVLQSSPQNLNTVMETSLLPYEEVFDSLSRYVSEISQVMVRRSCSLGVILSPAPSTVFPVEWLRCDGDFVDAVETKSAVVAGVMCDGSAWVWRGLDLHPVIMDCEQVKFIGVQSSEQYFLLHTQHKLFLWDTLDADKLVEVKDSLKSDEVNTVAGFAACQGRFCVWWRSQTFASVFDSLCESMTRYQCQASVTCSVFSPDSCFLYCGQEGGLVSVFDTSSNCLVMKCMNSDTAVRMIVSVNVMTCVCKTGSVIIWDVKTKPPVKVKEVLSDSEEIVNTDYLEELFSFLVCQHNRVTLWETRTWEMSDQFTAPKGKDFIQALLSQDGHLFLALLDTCSTVLVWRVSTGECVLSLDTSKRPVKLLRTVSDILCVTRVGGLTVWDAEMITVAGAAPRMRSVVKEVVVDRLGQWFYTFDGSETVWRWTLKTGLPTDSFLHDNPVEKVRLGSNSNYLVTLSAEEIFIWQTETKQNMLRISGGGASDVLIGPNCKFGVSLSEKGLSHVWKLTEGSIICSVHLYLSHPQITPESTFLIGRRSGDLLAANLWSGVISKRFSCLVSSQRVVAFQTLSTHPNYVVVMVASGGIYTWKVSEDTVCKHFQLPEMFHCQPEDFQICFDFLLLSTEHQSLLLLDLYESKLRTLEAEGVVKKACLERSGKFAAYISEASTCHQHVAPVLTVIRLLDGEKLGSVVLAKRPSTLVWSELRCVFVGFEDGSVGVYSVMDHKTKLGSVRLKKSFHKSCNGCPFDQEMKRWFPLVKANVTWTKIL